MIFKDLMFQYHKHITWQHICQTTLCNLNDFETKWSKNNVINNKNAISCRFNLDTTQFQLFKQAKLL